MCTQSQLNILLRSISDIYKGVYGNDIVKIMLYGSYARGTHDEDSDIDIVAIVHGERYSLQKKLEQVWEKTHDLGLEYDTILSPTVIPYDEFMEYKEVIPYYRNIDREGVSIVA